MEQKVANNTIQFNNNNIDVYINKINVLKSELPDCKQALDKIENDIIQYCQLNNSIDFNNFVQFVAQNQNSNNLKQQFLDIINHCRNKPSENTVIDDIFNTLKQN